MITIVIVSILAFVLVLTLLIFVHEAGHFLVARKLGIWVEEFGLGLPPRLFGKKRGNTIYSLNALPFGGFVRLHGENLDETITNPEVAYLRKSKKVRTAVVVAGVVMNLILGVLAFAVVYSFTGVPRETGRVKVVGISASSPAKDAGLAEEDIILRVGTTDITSNSQFINLIDEARGQEVTLLIERNQQIQELKVTPRLTPPEGEGALGIAISSKDIYFPPIWQRPFVGAYYGLKEAIFWGKAVLLGLGHLVGDLFGGRVPADIAGPVGIYSITSEVASLGILPLINFLGVLSVNLAIINILPIPALDGGRLLFIIFEAVTRKRVTPKIEATIHGVGMAALLVLLLVITLFDIRRLAEAGNLPGFLLQFFR